MQLLKPVFLLEKTREVYWTRLNKDLQKYEQRAWQACREMCGSVFNKYQAAIMRMTI